MRRNAMWKLAGVVTTVVALGCADDASKSATDSTGANRSPMRMMDSTGDASMSARTTPAEPDAQMQAVMTELASLGGKPIETLTPAEARRQPTPTDAVMSLLKKQGKPTDPTALVPGVTHADRTIAGAAGSIPARVYTPSGTGPFPVIVYYHGGGWVIGSKEVYDGGARGISKMANAVVVSIDYRLSPENKFPAAHDDAFAAYRWALANAASIKGDPRRVAVAGESAGGNLAVATAMAARDAGVQLPVHVLAVYPIAAGDTTSPSYVENATAKPLNRAMMSWFFDKYARTPADRQDPRVDLVGANTNLRGLPPTTIITAQIDPLRTEGQTLAQKLGVAGVSVDSRNWDGVTHEFFGMAAVVDKAREAQQYAADRLKTAFGAQ